MHLNQEYKMNKYSKENIARAKNIMILGGNSIAGLSDEEIVDIVYNAYLRLASALNKVGVTAHQAASEFSKLSKGLKSWKRYYW